MKKRAILPVLLLGTLLLTGCGRAAKTETVHLPAESQTPAPVVTPAPQTPAPMSEAEQRALIERNRAVWQPDTSYETWYYTTTDLDHNGRLEVLTASIQGSGFYTYVNCWEVNEACTGLILCPDSTGEGEAWPDIIKDAITVYRDPASGCYTCLCEDLLRDGMAHYWTGLDSFTLQNGQLMLRTLASRDEVYTDQDHSTVRFYDENGAEVTEETYNSTEQRAFAGQEKGTLTLNWTELAQTTPAPQPKITAQPLLNTQAEPDATVTITKHPTSETLTVGGNTWFIAHADHAERLVWILTSPQGQTCDLSQAMAANPGLQLQELPDDTLAVSNVPASVNGWSVQARFYGPGGSVVTSPAMIYVEDSLSSYAPVISGYYRAYAAGNTTAEYAFNNGLSEMMAYSAHAGYALQDLNGDGVDELIIAGILDDSYTDILLYDLYTLENGQPVQLACSRARSRYYLRSDGSILNEGSNGAGNSIFVINRLYGSALTPIESAFTWFEGKETDGYYHQTDGYNYEPRSYDEYLSEQQFTSLITTWESSVCVPQLTPFA